MTIQEYTRRYNEINAMVEEISEKLLGNIGYYDLKAKIALLKDVSTRLQRLKEQYDKEKAEDDHIKKLILEVEELIIKK
jgi:membrane-bound lytic murein transglycosylase MltF